MSAIEKTGMNVAKFSREVAVNPSNVGELLSMKCKAIDRNGNFTKTVCKIANFLNCSPEQLFTEAQINSQLESNKKTIMIAEAECKFFLENVKEPDLLENIVFNDNRDKSIDLSLDSLSNKERKIINMRFGLNGEDDHTLEEVGKQFDVTPQRIRQIERKALRKLRHPSRSEPLRTFLEDS